jgi:DNA-binding MarR family transcriptional regulator
MEPTSLSRTLRTMESKGLIFRKVDENDKRKVLIFLTNQGVEIRRQVRKVVKEFNEQLSNLIPKAKLKVFFEVMDFIDEAVEDELKSITRTI